MDYHREFLDQPEKHGIRIERLTGSNGTPWLSVTTYPIYQRIASWLTTHAQEPSHASE